MTAVGGVSQGLSDIYPQSYRVRTVSLPITQLVDCLPSVVRIPAQRAGSQLINMSAWEYRGPCAHFIDEEVRIEACHRLFPFHVLFPTQYEAIAQLEARGESWGHLRDHHGGGWRQGQVPDQTEITTALSLQPSTRPASRRSCPSSLALPLLA